MECILGCFVVAGLLSLNDNDNNDFIIMVVVKLSGGKVTRYQPIWLELRFWLHKYQYCFCAPHSLESIIYVVNYNSLVQS